MGLIARTRYRIDDFRWRFSYWWLDTENGERAHWAGVCIGVFIVIVQLIKMFVAAALPPPPGEPVKSVYWWVVQLIIAIIAAVVAYSMRPKPQVPAPQSNDAPTVEDGQIVKHHGGTCWVGDEFILAWKPLKPIPIKSKGGKK